MYGGFMSGFLFSAVPSDGARLWLLGAIIDFSTEDDLLRRWPATGAAESGVAIVKLPEDTN